MPVMYASKSKEKFYLVVYDSAGTEVPESGGLISDQVIKEVTDGGGATDVWVASHGWQWDETTAQSHYGSWVDEMMVQGWADGAILRARAMDGAHKSVRIAVHWPSLPFGDESSGSGVAGLLTAQGHHRSPRDPFAGTFTAEARLKTPVLVDRYASRIADTPCARDALRRILAATSDFAKPGGPKRLRDGHLTDGLKDAYQELYAESGLRPEGKMGPPGHDHGPFDPASVISDWMDVQLTHAVQAEPPVPLRFLSDVGHEIEALWEELVHVLEDDATKARDLLLAPVRVLSFWVMKNRARLVGETGVNQLLQGIRAAAPRVRLHLMGHSFGAIVVSAAISGSITGRGMGNPLARPVNSVFLAQAAMSLWSYAEEVVLGEDKIEECGFYRPILDSRLIVGPLVTTRSRYDMANGAFFPIGARLGSPDTVAESIARIKAALGGHGGEEDAAGRPEYGAVGTFGLRRTPGATTHNDIRVRPQPAHHPFPDYRFQPGHVYNADARRVIRHGPWPEGAHSDIVHPEIAELFWQAALVGMEV
ncbi:MAG TPA: hypothetical protein VHZ03_33425 [Trebonia sp.]|nr:hypothetical protein [Trebonia sp.]